MQTGCVRRGVESFSVGRSQHYDAGLMVAWNGEQVSGLFLHELNKKINK